jgi:hypothetical protein
MVTKPDVSIPPKQIEPATVVSGNASLNLPDGSDVANRDRSGDNKFKLPEKVTTKEIRDGSFKYGGGRSAGNRSLADNKGKQEMEP